MREATTTAQAARRVFFPLDRQLKLWDKHWSEGVVKRAVKYSGKLSYEETCEALGELGQIEISANSIWRLAQRWGEALKQVEQQEDQQANGLAEEPLSREEKQQMDQRLGVSMDGTMINIREEGWKELKAGCFFEVEQKPNFDPETKEWVEQAHAQNTTYVSHLGGPEVFGEKMWTEGKRRCWHQAVDTEAVGDGAPWIWNLVETYFYDAHQIVDWYHAVEHLANAAQLSFGNQPDKATAWRKKQETPLFQGHADRVSQAISQLAEQNPTTSEDLSKQAGYFSNQHHRMYYLEMRAEGWLIGSGAIESGGKRFKDRFTRSGARWSRAGAENLLPVRTAIMSKRFDERWRLVYNSPLN